MNKITMPRFNETLVYLFMLICFITETSFGIVERSENLNDGFIKIYRSLMDWEWYKDANTTRVFLHLLLNANWENSRYRGHDVPRGSLVCGRKKLAKDLYMTEQEIRTSINHLKSTNEITIKSTNRFSIITIVNWEKFQGLSEESTNKSTNNLTNNQPTANHIKEIKNIRSKEYYNTRFDANRGLMSNNYDFASLERETKERRLHGN